jgi:hypothetical protein
LSGPDVWAVAAAADPGRRDREAALAAAVRAGLAGDGPRWEALRDPALRRRAGYLLDVAQAMRGQTPAEAVLLAALRASLGPLEPSTFWPGEPPLPPGTDPVAERWGYSRGCDMARLKAALRRPVAVLPSGGGEG